MHDLPRLDRHPPPTLEREPDPFPGMREYRIIDEEGTALRIEIAERHYTSEDLHYLHSVLERIAKSGIHRELWPGMFVPRIIR